uniref:Alkylglycerol monooxygenase-like n=1 Tax=Sinocyclocheilus grahami TaxID=75366 RepID=A0A672MEL7_SINGR
VISPGQEKLHLTNVTVSQGLRMLFSLMTPNESSFTTVQEVPTYVNQATPYFIGLILLEIVLGWLKTDGPRIKINDFITSLSAGMMSRLPHQITDNLTLQRDYAVFREQKGTENKTNVISCFIM